MHIGMPIFLLFGHFRICSSVQYKFEIHSSLFQIIILEFSNITLPILMIKCKNNLELWTELTPICPLILRVQINLANLSGNTSLPGHDDSDGDEDEEDLPAALIRWREAVTKAVSAAQLHLCLYQLNKCIAWEKSIMKVVSDKDSGWGF